jgi:DNA processing protein
VTNGREKGVDLKEDENFIFSLIGFDKIHIDEVIEKSNLQTKDVMVILTGLEMKDLIRQFPGGFYIRK